MANIEKRLGRGDKTVYRARIRMRGHAPISATFERKTDAKRWAEATEASIREGRYFPGVTARSKTLSDLLNRFRDEELPQMPKMEPILRGQLKWWEDRLGHMLLADVTPAVISEAKTHLKRNGRGKAKRHAGKRGSISNATVNRYLQALSLVYRRAANEWEWVEVNPALKVKKLPEAAGRVRFLDDDERARLLVAAKQIDQDLYDAVVVSLSTGARKMEVMGLRWPQVDMKAGLIRLLDTKNKESRSVPLSGHALSLVQEREKVRRLDSDLVFPGRAGDKPKSLKSHWRRALEQAQIEDFRWHDLRHSAASYLAMNGATLREIAEVLGHKTLSMVHRYSHLSPDHVSSVVASMNAEIFGQ
jgi:integrase